VATADRAVGEANIAGVMGDARAAAVSAQTLVERLTRTVGQLQPLLASLTATARRAGEGTADLQQALTPLLRDAQAAAAALRETAEGLRQYPAGSLLGGPPPRGLQRAPESAR